MCGVFGFVSRDEGRMNLEILGRIAEATERRGPHAFGFAWVNPQHMLLFLLPLMTAGITTFYMFRMWFMTFTGPPRDEHVYEHAHESPRWMTIPLIVLAVCSIAVAWGMPIWSAEASILLDKELVAVFDKLTYRRRSETYPVLLFLNLFRDSYLHRTTLYFP